MSPRRRRFMPECVEFARALLRTHGVVLNFDFSVSDSRQLSILESGSREERRRVLGGVTGLYDVDVLPQLYTHEESRNSKELLLFTCMTLMRMDDLRPIGINTDNLAADFNMLVSTLGATQPPGTVVFRDYPRDEFVKEQVDAGRIVVSRRNYCIFGFEAGQDGLHVFKRLLLGIDLSSVEAAWGVRCLRKMLGSWNPATRTGDIHEDERDEMDYAAGRCPLVGGNLAEGGAGGVGSPAAGARATGARRGAGAGSPAAGARTTGARRGAGASQPPERSSLASVLTAYFEADGPLPDDAFAVLSGSAMDDWAHPRHGACVPPCAKAVILDEAARLTGMRGRPQRQCAAAAYKLAYPEFPSVRSIREDIQGLSKFLGAFRQIIFREIPRGSAGRMGKCTGGLPQEDTQAPDVAQAGGGHECASARLCATW